jgi:uncharacterized membrane protein
MTLEPLLSAPISTQFHTFAGLTAIVLGFAQFFLPKGTGYHRVFGWAWVVLMMTMLGAAFVIRDRLPWSPFSPDMCYLPDKSETWVRRCASIHMITLAFLLIIPYAILHARRHAINYHRYSMVILMFGALVVAGLFTLDTTRIMNKVLFGG